MSNTESFIEIEDIQRIERSNDVEDKASISSDLSGNEKAHRLHAIEEQLSRAETKCNLLKAELDFFRMTYVDSQENIKIENNTNGESTYTVKKLKRDCDHFKKYITVSRMANTNLNASTETSLIPHKEIDVNENDVHNVKRKFMTYENAIKHLKARLKEMKANCADYETVKKKKSKIHHTVSDVCIISSQSCADTKKSKKRSKTGVRMVDSHDTVRSSKKKTLKKGTKILDLKLSKGKFKNCEAMSIKATGNRFRRRKPKLKQITSRFTVSGGHVSHSVDRSYRNPYYNSDLVELYHNKVAKSVTSQSDIFYNQRVRKNSEHRADVHLNFEENNPNIHRVYEKYTLPESYEAQYAKYIPQKQLEQNGFKPQPSKNNHQPSQGPQLLNNQHFTTQQNLQKQLKQQKNQQYRRQQQQNSINIDLQAPGCDKMNQKFMDLGRFNQQFCKKSENITNQQFCKKSENITNQQFCKKSENIMNQQFCKKPENITNQHQALPPPPPNEVHYIQPPPLSNRCFTASTMRTNSRSNFFAGYNMFHHYQLPTISSRLKQVTKNYLQDLNIKTIPFVTTTSTTPSHNLGLNIQQVLSIMKTKHLVGGISPTLAHNMGIVTQSVGSYVNGTKDTVTNILSRIGSRPNCISPNRKPACPLLRHATAVAESELADVPEHLNEDNASILSSLNVTIDVPKVATEADLKSRAMTEWDQPSPRACIQPKCTCLLRKQTSNSNKIFNQFIDPNVNRPASYNPMTNSKSNPRTKQFKSAFSMQSVNPTPNKLNLSSFDQKQTAMKSNNAHTELTGKIREIRDVLANLHNDFQKLNDQYDLLSGQIQKNNSDVDPRTVYRLDAMEKELNAKEEEISVVIPLYQEVLDLKEQLRNLKERTSMLSMSVCSTNKSRLSTGYERTATLRLTKCLRQINNFRVY
ncbi:uncharacterized protein LOC123292472 [Chrysoperla carnea]|uniref:uncharacterized protein LOC123292472 n=1 Tax=Chrysoperla carnea TaxID=189513 RepID=UPI001D06383A|nr:uncharacterized protein LOC123292472 [Chrysoperla carnea]